MLEPPAQPPGAVPQALAQLAELRRHLRGQRRPVALLCLGAGGRECLERSSPERRADLDRALLGLIRGLPPSARLAFAPLGEEFLILLEADPQTAALVAELLVESGRELALDPGEQPVWVGAHVGLALDPPDRELYFETLTAVAQEGAVVGRARGGECVVHTQLYELMQRRHERALGLGPSPAKHGSAVSSEAPTSAAPEPARAPEDPAQPDEYPTQPEEDRAPRPALSPAELRRAELERRLLERLGPATPERPAPEASRPTPAAAPPHGQPPGPEAMPSAVPLPSGEELIRMARRMADEALEAERNQLNQRHREEISLLERRIQRLLRALEESEEEMHRLAELAAIDGGIPSAHRTVQGLTASEANYAVKRELMAQLLEANLELRRRIADSAA